MTSSGESARDFKIEAILMQQPSDPRLAYVNRRMYQTLHALDVELRREQGIAACEQPTPTLQANSTDQGAPGTAGSAAGAGSLAASSGASGSGGGGAGSGGTGASAVGSGGIGFGGSGGVALGTSAVAASTSTAATASANAAAGFGSRAKNIQKTSLASPAPGGGNGFTAPKIVPGSDNEIVAKRLRKAAEEEKDPALRAKLWKEYNDYKQGASAK
jgi:hypothetical protein